MTSGDNSLADRLPQHHPLRLLQTIAGEALQALLPSIEASCADLEMPALNLSTVLRASLLQALYSLNDPYQLLEHLRFNVLFRWFMGSLSLSEQITSATDFVEFQTKLIDNHTLKHFLEHVIKQVVQEGSPNSAYVASNLSRWINKYCPQEVFFREYGRAPITKMSCTVLFDPDRHPNFPEEVFYELACQDFPERSSRKEAGVSVEDGVEAGVESGGELYKRKGGIRDEPVFYSSSRQYYVTLLNAGAVSLTKKAPYDNWESFKERFEQVIKHCRATNSQAKPLGIICAFSNLLHLPLEVELSDYFNVCPPELPPIQKPQIIQEQGQNTYEFPRFLENFKVLTKLRYDDENTRLLYCLQAQPRSSVTEIVLDLECHWTKPLEASELSNVSNKLKENIYTAFHSLITDKTRHLFE